MSRKSECNKWSRRDRRRWKRKHGMRVDGASVKRVQSDLARRKGD